MDETIGELEEGESATVTFNMQIPENIEEDTYTFKLSTFYEYDEDEDEYDSNSKDDLDESFNFNLKINCVPEKEAEVLITADPNQDYEALAGEDVTVELNIENIGDEMLEFNVAMDDYEEWASEKKISPRSVTLICQLTFIGMIQIFTFPVLAT